MGIPEMLAQSPNGGGMEGFFNSPIAMILMPRTAARFQEAKKEQMLMAQIQRKQEFAYRFADSIKGTDPLSAAAIYADPSAIDNVLTMYHQNRSWKERNTIEQRQALEAERRKAEAEKAQKLYETNLPGGAGYYNNMMGQFLENSVAAKTQGPNMPGMPTAGEVASQNIDPKRMTMALSKDFRLPELATGDALRIMTDPKAVEDLQDNRRADIEQGAKTVDVVVGGVTKKFALNPQTGRYDIEVGAVPKSAEELKLGSQQITKMGPDGKPHIYAFVPGEGYTKDEGLAEAKADPNLGDHVEVWDPVKKKTMIMGWNPADQDFTKVIGEAEPKSGTPMYDKDGNITGYMGGSGPKGPTEAQQKGISLYEGAKDQYQIAVDNFDALLEPRNSAAASAGSYGRAAMTEDGQAAYDAVKQVAQNYIYALSGQQAPDSEVERIMGLVMPSIQDYPTAKKNKKILLHSMMRAIKARLPDKYADDMSNAPAWDGKKTVPLPTPDIPPMPKHLKEGGISEETWRAHPEYWNLD